MKNTENRLRRKLSAKGMKLSKSRAKKTSADNQGGYMITSLKSKGVIRGARYDLKLSDVMEFVNELEQ